MNVVGVCLWASLVIVVVSLAVLMKSRRSLTGRVRAFMGWLAFALMLAVLPLVGGERADELPWATRTAAAVVTTIQAFFVNVAPVDLVSALARVTEEPSGAWGFYLVCLLILAPATTLSVILSFLGSAIGRLRYTSRRWRAIHVFSELNERSLALARSIRCENRSGRVAIVFAREDSGARRRESRAAAAAKIGAFVAGTALSSPWWGRWHGHAEITFYLLSDDDRATLRDATAILQASPYAERPRTSLCVFSDLPTVAMGLRHRAAAIDVRLVQPARATIYEWLWRDLERGQGAGSASRRSAGVDLFRLPP